MFWKTKKQKQFARRNSTREFQIGAALVCAAMAVPGHAQESVAPEIPADEPEASVPVYSPPIAPPVPSFGTGTSLVAPFGSMFGSGSPLALNSLFDWGAIKLQPSISYRLSYGDGFRSRSGQKGKTVIQEVIPNFQFRLGDKWNFRYVPAFRFYSDDSFEDSLDHSFSLSGRTAYESWNFNLSQDYDFSSTPLAETGRQTEQESFSTSLGASYQINSKASMDFGLSQDFRFLNTSGGGSQNLSDSSEWSTMEWLNYQFWPRLDGGIGVGFGYAEVNAEMIYEQVNARLRWLAGNKLSLSVSGGFEMRQFLDSNEPDLFNPLMSASIGYQLFKTTSLSLSASRSVNRSYFQNQVTENTSVNLGLNQRLLGRLNLGVQGGFGTADYKGSGTGATANRQDEFTSYSVTLGMPIKRASASIFYSANENSSGNSGFGYSSTQVGFELSYAF